MIIKKAFFHVILSYFVLFNGYSLGESSSFKVMQYNLFAWNTMGKFRTAGGLVKKINQEHPDFITIQEGSEGGQSLVDFGLDSTVYQLAFPFNAAVGIYFDRTKWAMQENSFREKKLPSQDKWGVRYIRGALFQRLSDQQQLYVYSTHWSLCGSGRAFQGCDGKENLLSDAQAVAAFIAERSNPFIPVILGGDLNVDKFGGLGNGENFLPVAFLKSKNFLDTYRAVPGHENKQAYPGNTMGQSKIDYIFSLDGREGGVRLLSQDANIVDGAPSDHHYVTATEQFIN